MRTILLSIIERLPVMNASHPSRPLAVVARRQGVGLGRNLWGRVLAVVLMLVTTTSAADPTPALPEADAAVEIAAQEWPLRPGPRSVRILIHYPQGKLAHVNADTGLFLTLHNWGGTDCVGTAQPRELANRLNVIAICVNYLQSGKVDSIDGPEPYDFGYLQALDALRALHFVRDRLLKSGREFASDRLFCTGGSGGGNVTLMANKLAPRTFACVIDMCGMKKLSDDIAFHLPGGSSLNARYSRDPQHPYFLSLDAQELRYVGHPEHLAEMKRLGTSSKIFVVHGEEDATCPFADAVEMVGWMQRARLDVVPRFLKPTDLDGKIFQSAGHSLGNRTEIVFHVAGEVLRVKDRDTSVPRPQPRRTDFDLREDIRYRTSNGSYVISYKEGVPVGRFEPAPPAVSYPDHTDLSQVRNSLGQSTPIRTPADWEQRRQHILDNFQRVTGPLPSPLRRVPLDVKIVEETRLGNILRRKVTYQSDPTDRVPAYILFPASKPSQKLPAMLCLHQTTTHGKDEAAGVKGSPDLKYALELAERGYVCIVPDYPSLGEHGYDFSEKHGYVSGTMKAVWDNIRALDLLETLPEVDASRIGGIGHSLGGHNAIFTAVFEPRLKAIVSCCGFTSLRKDDLPSWTGPRYMPRLKTEFANDVLKVPYDFHELIASLAPRPFLAVAAEKDSDFNVTGVQDVITAAAPIYTLYGAKDRLAAHYPATGHSFPPAARQIAYEFLDRQLKRTTH